MSINIEVGISTLNDGLFNCEFRKDYNYLVIHQINNGKDYSQYISTFPSNVRYITSFDLGLSKSRNLALEHTTADYLWIMDDDVLIHDRAYPYFNNIIDKYPDYGMYVVSHSHLDIEFLSGDKYQILTEISAANVSSIDMIINRSLCGSIRFNEKFGLGTDFPSGEEYIFTCNLLSAGHKVLKSRTVCTYHPLISSGQDFYSTPNKLKAKLEMFKAATGLLKGYIYYFAFIIKKAKLIIRNRAFYNVLKSFL